MLLCIIMLCVLLFVVLLSFIYTSKLKNTKLEYEDLLKQTEYLRKTIVEKECNLSGLQKENVGLKNQNDYLQGQIYQNQQRLNKMISDGNQTARAAVDAFAEEYKKNQISIVDVQIQELRIERMNMETQLKAELEPLIKEVEDYKAKRNAIIEAQKREIELRDQIEYHKIQLSETVIGDIKYIQSILDRLSKPDVVAKVVWETYIQKPTKEMLNRIIGKEKKTGIYRITDINTQECYIGQGVDVARRITEHVKGTLGIQSIADQKIHHIMAEKGLQNWTFELLEDCAKESLNEREKFYIAYYRSNEFGYNKTVGG